MTFRTYHTFCAILLQFAVSVYAQPDIEWQRCLGGSSNDWASSIQELPDGGYILTGATYSNDVDVNGNSGEYDIWVVKLDEAGGIEWQKCLGGSDRERAHSLYIIPEGGFIICGVTLSDDGHVTGRHGQEDIWVVRLDSSGEIQWQKCLGGSGSDWGEHVRSTLDGGFILAGWTESDDGDVSGNHSPGSIFSGDAWVVKLDAAGNLEWQRCYGGSGTDGAAAIEQTLDGGYIMAGFTASNDGDVQGNHGGPIGFVPPTDIWVVKLDALGSILWQRCLGGTGREGAKSIVQTVDGGYIVAGLTDSEDGDVSGFHGYMDYWVVKLDATGNTVWQKCLGGTGWDEALAVRQTSVGSYIIAGLTNSEDGDVSGFKGASDYWIVRLDLIGDIEWQKCLGGSELEAAQAIMETNDGGFIVAGVTDSNDGDVTGNHGPGDVWVVKLAPFHVGLEHTSSMSFSIAPNPATRILYITIADYDIGAEVVLRDAVGRIMLHERVATPTQVIDLGSLASGTYLLTLYDSEGRRGSERLVVDTQ